LRRTASAVDDRSSAGPFRLDPAALELRVGEVAYRLTPLESRLLQLLIAHAGQPVTTERLLKHVWASAPGAIASCSNSSCIACARSGRHAPPGGGSRP